MEPWWQTVVTLGQDALIWLLGLATHGGTDRNKPPTIEAGRTSHAAHEVGKARRYAKDNGLAFEAKMGYRRLRRVTVQAKNGERDTMLTSAKGGGHMQLTPRVGISIFHHICSDTEFRRFLQSQLGVGQEEKPAQAEFPPDAPIHITIDEQTGNKVSVMANFTCCRCKRAVSHTYQFDLVEERFTTILTSCRHCNLPHSHYKGYPWVPPTPHDRP